MDKQYQDIHYILRDEEYVYRGVNIKEIDFRPSSIEITFTVCDTTKTLVLPKMRGSKLIID